MLQIQGLTDFLDGPKAGERRTTLLKVFSDGFRLLRLGGIEPLLEIEILLIGPILQLISLRNIRDQVPETMHFSVSILLLRIFRRKGADYFTGSYDRMSLESLEKCAQFFPGISDDGPVLAFCPGEIKILKKLGASVEDLGRLDFD